MDHFAYQTCLLILKLLYLPWKNLNSIKIGKSLQRTTWSPFESSRRKNTYLTAQCKSKKFCRFLFNTFRDQIYTKFVTRFIQELQDVFNQFNFWLLFSIFDPCKLLDPSTFQDRYKETEPDKFSLWYGGKTDTHKGKQ